LDFVRSEREFVSMLYKFKQSFIDIVEKRDTDDKRKLRELPSLAVCLDVFVAIWEWNCEFLAGLEGCVDVNVSGEGQEEEKKMKKEGEGEGEGEVEEPTTSTTDPSTHTHTRTQTTFSLPRLIEVLKRFAPGLKLYATYTSNNTEALHDLAKVQSVIRRLLAAHPLPPIHTHTHTHQEENEKDMKKKGKKTHTPTEIEKVEEVLYLPCLRLPQYQQYLAELMLFVPQDSQEFVGLCEAYECRYFYVYIHTCIIIFYPHIYTYI
jgi:hypothetical protein